MLAIQSLGFTSLYPRRTITGNGVVDVAVCATVLEGGMGGMEIVKQMLEIAALKGETKGDVLELGVVGTSYHAIDIDPCCRDVLTVCGDPPCHVFCDLLDTLQQTVRVELLRLMEEHENMMQEEVRAYKSGKHCADEKKQMKVRIKQKGEMLFDALMTAMDQHKDIFKKDARCAKHKDRPCEVMPDRSGGEGKGLEIFMAGTSCKDWSSMSCVLSLAGKSVLPFAVELQMVKRRKPHIFFHECTRNFRVDLLRAALPDYHVVSCLMRPTEQGFPINRTRRYSACVRNDLEMVAELAEMECLKRFPSFDGGALFCAPDDLAAALVSGCPQVRLISHCGYVLHH